MESERVLRSFLCFAVVLSFICPVFSLDEVPPVLTRAGDGSDTLEIFVMSLCPFARGAELAVLERLDTMAESERPVLGIHYLFYPEDVDGQLVYRTLHGEKEITENLVQMAIRDLMTEYYYPYLLARAKSGADWQAVAARAGMPSSYIEIVVDAIAADRDIMMSDEFAYALSTGQRIDGSPTFIWNGVKVRDIDLVPGFEGLQYSGAKCDTGVQARAAGKENKPTRASNDPEPPGDAVHAQQGYRALEGTDMDVLALHEPATYDKFRGLEIGSKKVFYRQHKIGEALVEGDIELYHFDKKTNEVLKQKRQWRSDLPEQLPDVIDRATAIEVVADVVKGEALSATLFYISPESEIFHFDPVPTNPCWVIRYRAEGIRTLEVVDAVTGDYVGPGISPPATAYSMTGPEHNNPCSDSWVNHANNARDWFNTMGYSTDRVTWPTRANVQSHVQSSQIAMFYELAHGGSTYFSSGCQSDGNNYENTYASDIETWIALYNKMPFTFVGSCAGLCDTSDNTFAYEFTKGDTVNTTAVGYCHMDSTDCETNCWPYAVSWQTKLFTEMNNGDTVKTAFDEANAAYPQCVGYAWGDCTRFHGDTSFRVKPVVKREPGCGDTIKGDVVLTRDLNCSGTALIIGAGGTTLDCQGHVLDGSDTGYGIQNQYSNVTIKNCTIRNFDTGIYLYDVSDNNLLYNNTVYSNDAYGIYINNGWSNELNLNFVYSNGWNGLYLYNNSRYNDIIDNDFRYNGWHGIQLTENSSSNTLEDNYIYDNAWSGIGVNTNSNVIENNNSRYNDAYGIHVAGTATGNSIANNTAYGNAGYGYYLEGVSSNTLTGNLADYNTTGGFGLISALSNTLSGNTVDADSALTGIDGYYGFYVYLSDDNVFSQNEVYEASNYAIHILSSDDNELLDNYFHNNSRGIYVSSSTGNTFYDNVVCDSTYQDFYIPAAGNIGDRNTCSSAYNYADDGQASGCDYLCSGCAMPQDDMVITTSTVLCPGSYSITDVAADGLIMIEASGITVSGNGTTITGDGSGYGVEIIQQSNVTVQNLTLDNYSRGVVISNDDAGGNNIIRNMTLRNMTSYGIHTLRTAGNQILNNTMTGNGDMGIRLYNTDGTLIQENTIQDNAGTGVYILGGSDSANNVLMENQFCGNTMDIYNDGTNTSGNFNTCDVVSLYADDGQANNCDFGCSGCRRVEDNLEITADTVLCRDTYTVTDNLPSGVIQIKADNVTLAGNGSTIISSSSGNGYAVDSDGFNNVIIKDLTLEGFFIGINLENGTGGQLLGNRVDSCAAGIRLWNADDSLVRNNIATACSQGGIMLTQGATGNTVDNNTMVGNMTYGFRNVYGSSGLLTNSILWDNTPGQVEIGLAGAPAQSEIRYCDIEGGLAGVSVTADSTLDWGLGNIHVNPLFADAANGDFHLQSSAGRFTGSSWVSDGKTSRAIDAGNPAVPVTGEYFSLSNLRINMGAYGRTKQASHSPLDWSLRPDLTNDGIVNLPDFGGLAAGWLSAEPLYPGNINRSAPVNLADLIMMADDWLEETAWH